MSLRKLYEKFRDITTLPERLQMSITYRGRPWQWRIFSPLRGRDYWAFWFGPFKIIVRD